MVSLPEAVIEAAQAGDKDAFSHLYATYYPLIARYCTSLTGSREEGEDCAQDVFIRAMGAIANTAPGLKVSGWLHRIALHRVIDAKRREAKVRMVPLEEASDLVEHPPFDFLAEYTDILTPEEARILTLRYRDLAPYTEIARAMNLPDARIRKALRKAEAKIRATGNE